MGRGLGKGQKGCRLPGGSQRVLLTAGGPCFSSFVGVLCAACVSAARGGPLQSGLSPFLPPPNLWASVFPVKWEW